MKPVKRINGAISNAKELTVNEVVHERVVCPLCNNSTFEKWPLGWDAHAAYRCEGLSGNTPGKRKLEFKDALLHLFR